jgi:AcrR family transcriptional regulator
LSGKAIESFSEPSRRRYHSPRRSAAARSTRQAVLQAADSLFLERGYAGTTLGAIAARAEVSLATVKLVGQTKAALMLQVAYARARGDTETAPMTQRPFWAEMMAEPDAHGVLRRFVDISGGAHERQARIFEVIWQAAPSHPELAEIARRGAETRRADYREVVRELGRRGALRSDLDEATAVDIVWAVNSPQLYRVFADAGWAPERWRGWLHETLADQLLKR